MSNSRPLSPVDRAPSERQLKMLGYSSPTYNIELRSPSTQSRVRELESQVELLKRQNFLKDEAIKNMMMEHEDKLDESDKTWADRCASLGNKLKAERAEYDAYSVHHREFLADLAAILGVKTLNMTEIKDAMLTLHLKYLDLEQHMQQVEQDKFLYKQEADDKVSSAQQTAAAAMTRALAAEATMAAANKRAAAAEAQVAASGRSVAAAQTVADVEVSLAKQRAAAAEAKAAEVVQEAMQDKLAAQQKAQSAESEAIAAATAHKQAAALLTAALVDMQQRQDGLQASVADLMQSSMFDRIKALLSIERSVASPERRAASPMGADRPVSPAAGVVHGGLASPCSPQERYSRTSGRCL